MIQCPKCKSRNVIGWRELTCLELFNLNKDGTLYKKPYSSEINRRYTPFEGWECLDCGNSINTISELSYQEWIIKEKE